MPNKKQTVEAGLPSGAPLHRNRESNEAVRLYDNDFFQWTEETARAIAEQRWNDIDREALVDEVESLGKRDRREVVNRLKVLLRHLLKCRCQPDKQTASWLQTIDEQRQQLALVLDDSPSLRARADTLLGQAYPAARRGAQRAWMRAAKQGRNSSDFRAARLTPGPFCASSSKSAAETGMDEALFPAVCPWSATEVIDGN